jgi:hypothetical protein
LQGLTWPFVELTPRLIVLRGRELAAMYPRCR